MGLLRTAVLALSTCSIAASSWAGSSRSHDLPVPQLTVSAATPFSNIKGDLSSIVNHLAPSIKAPQTSLFAEDIREMLRHNGVAVDIIHAGNSLYALPQAVDKNFKASILPLQPDARPRLGSAQLIVKGLRAALAMPLEAGSSSDMLERLYDGKRESTALVVAPPALVVAPASALPALASLPPSGRGLALEHHSSLSRFGQALITNRRMENYPYKQIIVWDKVTGQETNIGSFFKDRQLDDIEALAVTEDGRKVYVEVVDEDSKDGFGSRLTVSLVRLDLQSGLKQTLLPRMPFADHQGPRHVTSRNGRFWASREGARLAVFDLRSEKAPAFYDVGGFYSLKEISDDGQVLAGDLPDDKAALWRLPTADAGQIQDAQEIARLPGRIAFVSPDGLYAGTRTKEGGIEVFLLERGKPIRLDLPGLKPLLDRLQTRQRKADSFSSRVVGLKSVRFSKDFLVLLLEYRDRAGDFKQKRRRAGNVTITPSSAYRDKLVIARWDLVDLSRKPDVFEAPYEYAPAAGDADLIVNSEGDCLLAAGTPKALNLWAPDFNKEAGLARKLPPDIPWWEGLIHVQFSESGQQLMVETADGIRILKARP